MKRGLLMAVASTSLGLAFGTPAQAQGPGQGGRAGWQPNGGGPQGGGWQPGGRMPFAMGSVSSVDKAAGTITISGRDGTDQVIKVGSSTKLTTQTPVLVSDLKLGDKVAVQGVPTGIVASQLTAGDAPTGLPGAGGPGGPAGFGGRPGGGNGGPATAQASSVMARGVVKALPTAANAHLTITLDADTTLIVKINSGAKITKYASTSLSKIRTGDRIVALGDAGDDGVFVATAVGVNLPQSNMGVFGARNGGPQARMPGGPGGNPMAMQGGGFGGSQGFDGQSGPGDDMGGGGFDGPPPMDGGGGFGGGGFDGPPLPDGN